MAWRTACPSPMRVIPLSPFRIEVVSTPAHPRWRVPLCRQPTAFLPAQALVVVGSGSISLAAATCASRRRRFVDLAIRKSAACSWSPVCRRFHQLRLVQLAMMNSVEPPPISTTSRLCAAMGDRCDAPMWWRASLWPGDDFNGEAERFLGHGRSSWQRAGIGGDSPYRTAIQTAQAFAEAARPSSARACEAASRRLWAVSQEPGARLLHRIQGAHVGYRPPADLQTGDYWNPGEQQRHSRKSLAWGKRLMAR